MKSPELNAETLLTLTQAILADVPVGLLLLDGDGRPLWFNHEAALVCAVWVHGERTGTALRLRREMFRLPSVLKSTCDAMISEWRASGAHSGARLVRDPVRGLYARVGFLITRGIPAFYLQLDYRRPRSDRDRPLSAEALAEYSRLTEREREVALRVRDGLSTREIAAALHRSPLTIKTQLARIFAKLGVNNRTRVAAILNR